MRRSADSGYRRRRRTPTLKIVATLDEHREREARGRRRPSSATVGQWTAGLGLIAAITVAATLAGRAWPVVGAPVVAIVLGVFCGRIAVRARWIAPHSPVLAFAQGRLLQLAVVLLGAQLSLRELANIGLRALPVMLGTLAVCLAAAQLVGRRMGVERDLRILVGVGTGICGASAIAAVSSTIRARQADIAYAISTIFLFNVVAVIVFPPLGHALGMSQQAFGTFAGTAVNDTSSVVAAAQTYGGTAEQHAVVVKLVRTLMIVPITLWLSTRTAPVQDVPQTSVLGRVGRAVRLVPTFLAAFVLVVAVNSAGLLPHVVRTGLADAAPVLVTAALAAIGLSVDARALRSTGARPLVLGLVLWALVSLSSLGLQALTM